MNSDIVKEFEVTINVAIREYDGQYDWVMSNGDESDELFDSIAEAREDVERRF